MRKSIIIFTLLQIGLWFTGKVQAQCNLELLDGICKVFISEGYTYLKAYPLDITKATNNVLEFPYVLSKDTQYQISLCNSNGESNGIEVKIYNNQRKEVFSNFDPKTKKLSSKIGYRNGVTGVYYITFKLSSPADACGYGLISFKR